jgi:hypothetical protein
MHVDRNEATRAVSALAHVARIDELALARELLRERRPAGVRCLCVAVVDVCGVAVRVAAGDGLLALCVGRHDAADLKLQRADGSLRHVVVCADDRGVHIFDLASTFGVEGVLTAPPGEPVRGVAGPATVVAVVVDADADIPPLGAEVLRALPRSSPALRLLSLQAFDDAMAKKEPARRRDDWRPGARDTVPLTGMRAPVLIGRLARNDVVVDVGVVDGVSRVHAMIVPLWHAGVRCAFFVDVGSTNGSRVIGVRRGRLIDWHLGPALRGVVIEPDDILGFSRCELRVVGALSFDENDGKLRNEAEVSHERRQA